MHPALLISEVLLDIFTHVNKIPGPPNGRQLSLAALARTCKTFHEPAMDLLWAQLNGIEPLLGCVTRLHAMIYGHVVWSDLKPLSEHEINLFLRHAVRVRLMHITSHVHFHLLSVLPNDTCMFPRLLSLSTIARPTKYLYLFLSPTLRWCVLPNIHLDLEFIVTRCAGLRHLSIRSFDESASDKLSLLSRSVRLCRQLVTLSCPPLDLAAWEHLSNLPTLLAVVITRTMITVPCPLDLVNLNFASFLNLTTLYFFVKTAEYPIAVMQHSGFPALKKFEMVVHAFSWTEAEQLFRALSQCKACQTLEHISIASYDPDVQQPSGNSFTAVTHFLCFTQLRTLRLMLRHFIFLNNDLLLEAMSSWPHIRSLELVDRQMASAVTFRGLFTALRRCPHLHTLHLLLDAQHIDIDPKAESFQHTALQILDLTWSHVADAEAVARIIFSMLPCVDRVAQIGTWCTGSRPKEEWYEVNRHLKSLKSSAVLGCHITGEAAKS
ncbi:uncharacterized protein EDB91DRAFT_191157 [Suillus paluster]|uniref:uncharacterized protein n=1 Tax=Suillus paluster TaxID=48578 RepID=UPI001B87F8F9|nr:uncharacterized protein EDB91DRAFT_191157 [Suillus paluster]KAG1744568.1 hypothetical protein EDB91DRAFT_191157 [Suillus paluster]